MKAQDWGRQFESLWETSGIAAHSPVSRLPQARFHNDVIGLDDGKFLVTIPISQQHEKSVRGLIEADTEVHTFLKTWDSDKYGVLKIILFVPHTEVLILSWGALRTNYEVKDGKALKLNSEINKVLPVES